MVARVDYHNVQIPLIPSNYLYSICYSYSCCSPRAALRALALCQNGMEGGPCCTSKASASLASLSCRLPTVSERPSSFSRAACHQTHQTVHVACIQTLRWPAHSFTYPSAPCLEVDGRASPNKTSLPRKQPPSPSQCSTASQMFCMYLSQAREHARRSHSLQHNPESLKPQRFRVASLI